MKVCSCTEIGTYADYCAWAEVKDPSYTVINDDLSDFPCYIAHIIDTENLPEGIHPGEFLSIAADYSGTHTLMFSVTEKEHNYLDWLYVAHSIPGSTIHEVDRGYMCYLCIVPTTPDMDKV